MGIPIVSDILNSLTGADEAADAAREGARLSADATVESTEKNIDFQTWLWGEQKALTEPYATAGRETLPAYLQEIQKGFTLDDFYADPGYQFGLNEGIRTRENAASSRGMTLSGPQQKAMQRFGTDYASTKYNESFNRRQTGLDNLYRMIMMGSNAASGQATQGGEMGRQVSSSINTAGQATAGMYSDIGNISASEAMAPWNTLMDVGSLAVGAYGASRL